MRRCRRAPVNRLSKRAVSTALARYVANPITKHLASRVPWWALIETKGRTSGLPRQTPVGNGLRGDTFWLISEHGSKAAYVKNIMADPHVRIRVHGRWRNGVAHLMPEDDVKARQATLGRFNTLVVNMAGTEPLTVRVDLEP